MSDPRDIIGDDYERERLCAHGVGHAYPCRHPKSPKCRWHGVHTCDGCCAKEGFFDPV
jgi:hypothetical protein